MEKKSDQDPVDKELEALFKFVDANWHLGPLPAGLQAEHVLNRLRTLLAESHENPLPVLAEARMYQTRGLLQDSHYPGGLSKAARRTRRHTIGHGLGRGKTGHRRQMAAEGAVSLESVIRTMSGEPST